MVATSSLWAANERPNIILFLVDDMGWQETSVPFHSEETPLNRRFHTPNMEKLAEKGVKFMQAYSCAISSPSRCSLMSGMNAARHRVTNWTLNYNSNNDAGGGSITLPDWNYNGIQPAGTSINNATSITSLPQILHDNGYYTIHCGKAHFGAKNTDGEDPLNFGFDVNISGGANGGPA
ncbi:sulfatase-like hydrolase/transferase [Barnesiella viscericola]|uniref:sulfatase-like hydrolase/transferase n=1 Tax=Barnesiella viscericola TaxID=397865 RepID=UPI002354463B|nr:sulfatase-like hydrolase/transferase [Barnesiella viscericola]